MATFVNVATAILLAAGALVAVASPQQTTKRKPTDRRFRDIWRLNPDILEARPRVIIRDPRDSH
ncbi:MAG TPA: hypothetical protein VMU60_13695 [Syntrophobacteria bacterium]|jgi:hypothetical protein|nr:hypothetical protein [Syntrophobacteria bacterium]